MTRKALITGITGQIGSYLAEILLEKKYEVIGFARSQDLAMLPASLAGKVKTLQVDIGNLELLEKSILDLQPDEIYNFAAQSNSQISFGIAEETFHLNALAVVRLCETARKLSRPAKVFQASTAELYGGVYEHPVNEETPFYPKNPYGIAKLAAYWAIRNYRETQGAFFVNGIIFNSESPRRGEAFVTKKIVKTIAEIIKGKQEVLRLGNLNARRDWSHAQDTAKAAWTMLQAEKAADYVIASGVAHSVREFVEIAFKHAGIEIAWRGEGVQEEGYDKNTGKVRVAIDTQFFRPAELKSLIGDSSKLHKELGWSQKYPFDALVSEMLDVELEKL